MKTAMDYAQQAERFALRAGVLPHVLRHNVIEAYIAGARARGTVSSVEHVRAYTRDAANSARRRDKNGALRAAWNAARHLGFLVG